MSKSLRFSGTCPAVVLSLVLGWSLPLPAFAQIPAPLEAGTTNSNYYLGPGDEFQLTVLDYPEFTGTHVILPDGTITLPLIGKVTATDRSVEQLTQELRGRLRSYLKNPAVTIAMMKLRSMSINVAGEVQRPGPIQLASLTAGNNTTGTNPTNNRIPTVSAAILQAGGVTRNADIRNVILKRYSPTGNGSPITINLWEALWSEDAPRDLMLRDGDSIYVPTLPDGETVDRRMIARSSVAPQTVRVRVVGEVKTPGEVEVSPNSSISSAIAKAGGPTDKAKLSKVEFVRLNDEGRVENQTLDVSNLTDEYQIQEGDVIFVPKSNTDSIIDFAGRVLSPLNSIFRLLGF